MAADAQLARGFEKRLEDRLGRALDERHDLDGSGALDRLGVDGLAKAFQQLGAGGFGRHAGRLTPPSTGQQADVT